ncbi:phenylalanine--tRNA ligase subunit alpha [Candidatus Hydrogenosomobacter endosymbioticus]|uniref:Phenylalanine--tRNA ligase alpha subunit n=1 Tax=Candidatus Hydrogenosomobacter endosymbioticus TaxID=2558174 RepID=A0ABN6L2G2_9PROT|nr:phenylalanine--tRNA ligase subunit alpha [Candidatus Hydrogenosomobacter endosymbioticus]BDB95904.1 phenylalanine--tRNA ligase alpha subunit [Candidatus Hydrogenosomobacter endosymbioticus]
MKFDLGSIMYILENASSLEDLEKARLSMFGKDGSITEAINSLRFLSGKDKAEQGKELNKVKTAVLDAIAQKKRTLEEEALNRALLSETIDMTAPYKQSNEGREHPITHVIEEVTEIFSSFGFSVQDGPEIETSFYNFDALCVPHHHPSRSDQDTFYFDSGALLRTQTSSVQIRSMQKLGVPLRIIAPGRVYRPDYDNTHSPMFHQIEGLAVGYGVTMAHLKWCLEEFCRRFFDRTMKLRFRASFFPFTEPSMEVDVPCRRVSGKIEVGMEGDWLELLGCGMVHPDVFKNCGIQDDKITGFAFGMGVERLAMVKYGIGDLRDFFCNDQRFLKYYGFSISDKAH